ncbi:hypothetical protein MRX96_042577 [Rhipicephalus microplus]
MPKEKTTLTVYARPSCACRAGVDDVALIRWSRGGNHSGPKRSAISELGVVSLLRIFPAASYSALMLRACVGYVNTAPPWMPASGAPVGWALRSRFDRCSESGEEYRSGWDARLMTSTGPRLPHRPVFSAPLVRGRAKALPSESGASKTWWDTSAPGVCFKTLLSVTLR